MAEDGVVGEGKGGKPKGYRRGYMSKPAERIIEMIAQ